MVAIGLLVGLLLGTSVVVARTVGFLHSVVNFSNPFTIVQHEIAPPPGSIAWKLRHGQQVNLLMLGDGGLENDSPLLTDTIMVVMIDPGSKRIVEASVPRDLWVKMDAWGDGRTYSQKINVANQVGGSDAEWPGKKAEYTGKDGGGHLATHMVNQVTGVQFDKYVTVDFKAFRDIVDAVGGIDITLDGPLDDCHYPDYHNGYINHGVPPGYPCPAGAGIHFNAGLQHISGEQALEIARSRDASEPDQATDFGRAKRQQTIVNAIRHKAASAGALAKAPQLMNALQKNFTTDMDLNDLKALYDFAGSLPDSSITRVALTDTDLLTSYVPYQRGSCGDRQLYVLCPEDQSYQVLHRYFASLFIDPKVAAEKAPIQVANASRSSLDLQDRVTTTLRPFNLNLGAGVRQPFRATSIVYDYSGGAYPQTAAWLGTYFKAPVQPATPAAGGSTGFVVVLGNDYATAWYGLG